MSNTEIELNPVDFITIGTIGPKGRRQFHLQAGADNRIVSLLIEKEQARALSETLTEMLDDLLKRDLNKLGDMPDMGKLNMDLRDPVEPQFRVGQMGIGYDDKRDLIILVAQEVVMSLSGESDDSDSPIGNLPGLSPELSLDEDDQDEDPSIVRVWATRPQMRALSVHTMNVVRSGRVDPQSNGRLLYYWT